MYVNIDGTAKDHEKFLELIEYIDWYVIEEWHDNNFKREGYTWHYSDDGVLEFKVKYVSDTKEAKRLGS